MQMKADILPSASDLTALTCKFHGIPFSMRPRSITHALVGLFCLRLSAQTPLLQEPSKPMLLLGAAWYPARWPESCGDADLTLMAKAHIYFVLNWRICLEQLGTRRRHLSVWLARARNLYHRAVVLGTPGAALPAWLTAKFPEILRPLPDGRKDEHGNREQFDFTSSKYREVVERITTKLAQRFGNDPRWPLTLTRVRCMRERKCPLEEIR